MDANASNEEAGAALLCALTRGETRKVTRQRVDVLVGEGLGCIEHRGIAALAVAESAELPGEIRFLLSGEARHLLVPAKIRAVASGTVLAFEQWLRGFGNGRIGLLIGRLGRDLREETCKIGDVLVGEIDRHRGHLCVLAAAIAEQVQLLHDKVGLLSGERRHLGRSGISIGPMAGEAGLSLRLPGQRLGARGGWRQ